MSSLVCVECGEPVGSLYVEFSETNIRLTRCQGCSKVVDKYVEYELVLVFIDIILHRKQAYRHLIFNRINEGTVMKSLRWIPVAVVLTNILLKLTTLHKSKYEHLDYYSGLHVTAAAVLEHAVFMIVLGCYLYFIPSSSHIFNRQNKLKYKIYIYLAFPELLKLLVVLLQTFDSEASLLILAGLLILSVQYRTYECLLSTLSQKHLMISMFLAVICRMLVKRCLYSMHDVYVAGIVT